MDQAIVSLLKEGKVGILPTDTLYGLVGSALKPETVKRIYQLKSRNPDKPLIVLISSLDDLKLFDIQLSQKIQQKLEEIWPNPVSVILPCLEEKLEYLHRGTHSIAFRIPKLSQLIKLLKQTGPLVAPSANLEGQSPAQTIEEAKLYFGNTIDFYLDGGKLTSQPSTLLKIEENEVIILREGAFPYPKNG